MAPIAQCPIPATSVKGTACTISEPTIRAIGSFGYSSSSAVTPTAPAPTDEIETSTPSMAPTSTVARPIVEDSSRSTTWPRDCNMVLRKISEAAVSTSANDSTTLIRLRAAALLRSSCQSTTSVKILAGILPLANLITAGQCTLRAQLCTTLPPALVPAA